MLAVSFEIEVICIYCESYFANHCPHGGALQKDFYQHSEPDEPFYSIPRAAPDPIKLTPIVGRIQLSGDQSYEV